MATWLYQCRPKEWPPSQYRLDIWEGVAERWPVGRKVPAGKEPEPGDIVACFYSESGGTEPGFYGWAVVLQWLPDARRLRFRPAAPSDYLKMDPWWWLMSASQEAALRRGVRGHLGGAVRAAAKSG